MYFIINDEIAFFSIHHGIYYVLFIYTNKIPMKV